MSRKRDFITKSVGSRRREFHVALAELAQHPDAEAISERILTLFEGVLDACEAGDRERAEELIDDYTARALLSQALPGWEWGTVDGGHD